MLDSVRARRAGWSRSTAFAARITIHSQGRFSCNRQFCALVLPWRDCLLMGTQREHRWGRRCRSGVRRQSCFRVGRQRTYPQFTNSVIGSNATVRRFPTMKVPCVTELSCVGAYRSRCVELAFASPRSVASRLRCVNARSVASASVGKRSVASLVACVSSSCVSPGRVGGVASAFQSSPRVALAPVLQSLRHKAAA